MQDHTNTEKMLTDIRVLKGFEPTIPVFERAKSFYTLDRAVTVIGFQNF
jgi:hypothetical protein